MWDDFDLFVLFRRLLVIFGATYTLVRTASMAAHGLRLLRSRRRKVVWLRGYVFAQLAQMRLRRFLPDAAHILLLVGVLAGVVYLHRLVPHT